MSLAAGAIGGTMLDAMPGEARISPCPSRTGSQMGELTSARRWPRIEAETCRT
jgi:hypothetical protein